MSDRVEALAVWEVSVGGSTFGVYELLRLARGALAQALEHAPRDIALSGDVLPVQVVLDVDASGKVQRGIVSVPNEERWGREWADENQTVASFRVFRLVREALG